MITFIICIVLFFVLFFIGFATFLLQDVVEQSKAKDIQIDNAVKYEDLMYFQNKLNNTTDPIKREKIQKQIDLLEDALIVYRLHSEIKEIK